MAMYDALIGVFDTKYHAPFWRPETAIQLGHVDGHDKTAGDAGVAGVALLPVSFAGVAGVAFSAFVAVFFAELVALLAAFFVSLVIGLAQRARISPSKLLMPLAFSSILTKVSPSGKALTVHLPSSMPIDLQIDLASG